MIQTVNRRQSLEVVLTVVMSLMLLLNVNSIANGVGMAANEMQLGTKAEQAVDSLAGAADSVQHVTETGVVQNLVGLVTGTNAREAPTVEASNGTTAQPVKPSGNVGEWIDRSGSFVLGLFTPSEQSRPAQFATALGQQLGTIPQPMQEAGEPFSHLSRPLISNWHVDEEVLEQMEQIHAALATMIVVW